ncbi:hypothetical protein [Sphingomonas xinjiangensis]|uniref:Uncharacterized protein n=1 Tax=Sphingomonas xinjiangensis TaxID=643568 RepID=A0A840YR13_9SPHN|nr:hypothetical protein [Sphingomonas xinjiangensis]MBB5711103.1 hypothetical protein [Sphingomonas xinjiangensis]
MTEFEYFRARAIDERLAAMRAACMRAFRAHMDMACEYERRCLAG